MMGRCFGWSVLGRLTDCLRVYGVESLFVRTFLLLLLQLRRCLFVCGPSLARSLAG